jgi:hypothetical protein
VVAVLGAACGNDFHGGIPMTIERVLKWSVVIAALTPGGCSAPVVPSSSGDGSTDSASAPDATTDSASLGSQECARVGAACPSVCFLVEARKADYVRRCLLPSEPVVCSNAEVWHGGFECSVRIVDGATFLVPKVFLAEPQYVGWRRCSSDERTELPTINCP